MATIDDVVIIADGDKDRKTTYDCKGKTGLCMPDTWSDFTKEGGALRGVSANGNTLYVTVHMCIDVTNDQETWKDVKLTFKNYNYIKDVYCLKTAPSGSSTPKFPDDYETNSSYYDYIVGKLTIENDTKGKIVGSNFDDKVSLENNTKKFTVDTKSGADEITLNNTYADNMNPKVVNTIKAGNGDNVLTVKGSGSNAIISGKNDDTFNFEQGVAVTTIKAGAGKNTFNIKHDQFRSVTIMEEKVKAENKVNITGNLTDYSLTKFGNDLLMTNDTSALQINSYFATGGKYATTTVNELDFNGLLTATGKDLTVRGFGKIQGTDNNDNIISDDFGSGLVKGDKIYSGKGTDTICAGKGKNSIFLYCGDGIKTVQDGGGKDTLVFKKGTSVKLELTNSGEADIFNLKIYYGKDSKEFDTNYVVMDKAVRLNSDKSYSFISSVKSIKIGNKSYTLDSLTNKNKIENVISSSYVIGTTNHDEIYVTDSTTFDNKGTITVVGNKGSDTIMIGNNVSDDGSSESHAIYAIDNTDDYNYDPAKYQIRRIKPIVYTYSDVENSKDTTKKTSDRIVSYASEDGVYNAQSTNNYIEVYGWHLDNEGHITTGTDDTYNVYYDKQYTKICDEAGTNDVLNILDKNHNELKLVFNLSKDYKDFATEFSKITSITDSNKEAVKNIIANSIQEIKLVTASDRAKFLKNPDKNGDIGIDIDYWGNKGIDSDSDDKKSDKLLNLNKDTIAKFGSGVEKIVASDGYYITSEDISNLASDIAGWLTNNAFGNFDEVKDLVGNKSALSVCLAEFDKLNWHEDTNA